MQNQFPQNNRTWVSAKTISSNEINLVRRMAGFGSLRCIISMSAGFAGKESFMLQQQITIEKSRFSLQLAHS